MGMGEGMGDMARMGDMGDMGEAQSQSGDESGDDSPIIPQKVIIGLLTIFVKLFIPGNLCSRVFCEQGQ